MGMLIDWLLEVVLVSDRGRSGGHGASRRELPLLAEILTFSWLWSIPIAMALGFVVILIYVTQVPSAVRWSVFGTALAIAGAAYLTGAVVGFLFGIPQTAQGFGPSSDGTQYRGNTNLEHVSDWLTKIIVGVGLVQIGRAIPALSKLAEILKVPLGGQPSSAAFGLGLTITYALWGFFYLYLWSRAFFARELQLTSTVKLPSDERKSTNALILV